MICCASRAISPVAGFRQLSMSIPAARPSAVKTNPIPATRARREYCRAALKEAQVLGFVQLAGRPLFGLRGTLVFLVLPVFLSCLAFEHHATHWSMVFISSGISSMVTAEAAHAENPLAALTASE